MLVSFKGSIVNLDNVTNTTIECQRNIHIITFWFNYLGEEEFAANIDFHWKKEEDRDKAFYKILSDCEEGKRLCRLD